MQPEQPTLHDGDLLLRPWRDDDVETALLGFGQETADWLERSDVAASRERWQQSVAGWRSQYADGRRAAGFVVERAGQVAGAVEVRRSEAGNGQLSWALFAGHRGRGSGVLAVRMLVAYAFDDLALSRVEAFVEPGNVRSLRLAARAGLRREGIVRGRKERRGRRVDDVLVARLVTDPEPASADGFRAVLNAGLPLKRVIAQGLLRDPAGHVLLCQLTYKNDWDLPGGVVEPLESPRECVVREVAEELGIEVTAGELITVDWLPPWAGWDDACLLMFDLGVVPADTVSSMRLEPREIAAVHWADPQLVRARCRPQVADRLELVAAGGPVPHFLHSGRSPR